MSPARFPFLPVLFLALCCLQSSRHSPLSCFTELLPYLHSSNLLKNSFLFTVKNPPLLNLKAYLVHREKPPQTQLPSNTTAFSLGSARINQCCPANDKKPPFFSGCSCALVPDRTCFYSCPHLPTACFPPCSQRDPLKSISVSITYCCITNHLNI